MLIFYDFEVFKYDFLAVFIIPERKEVVVIENEHQHFKDFYLKHKNDIFIGFNSRHYDQYIFKGILLDMNPYEISKHIIGGKNGWEFSRSITSIHLNNFDVKNTMHSLKELEAFMGNDIRESDVDFDIDRKLTDKERVSVIEYCKHDVEQTIEVFLNRKEQFDSQISLLKEFKLPLKYVGKTKPQLAAIILGARKSMPKNDELEFMKYVPSNLQINKYTEVLDWFNDPKNSEIKFDKNEKRIYEKLKLNIYNVLHVVAFGGMHGARNKYQGEGIFVNFDIASYYPALMIEYDFLSRNIKNPNRYKEIRDTRMILKAKKDPKQEPYKIVLNSTFGASKSKYNLLYDPLQPNCICVMGQLFLVDLLEKLEEGLGADYEVIQTNTDGILGKVKSMETYEELKKICAEWEKRTRFKLEFNLYKKIWQKDVNNYLAIDTNNDPKLHVKENLLFDEDDFEENKKTKGSYVKKLHALDNDLPIINKAIIDYFVKNISVEYTVNNCSDVIMFQKVNKITYKFDYCMYGDEKISGKCFRTFASTNSEHRGLFKVKIEDGVSHIHKVSNTPDKCFIINDSLRFKTLPKDLDKSWYIDVAKKRILDFIGEIT